MSRIVPLFSLKCTDMFSLKDRNLFKIIDIAIYIVLMFIGIYFIQWGKVWERYQQRRTNFAEYDEPIRELPTIVTWIQYLSHVQSSQHLKFGEDYSLIYWEHPWWATTALKTGVNTLPNNQLKVEDKFTYFWDKRVKITPLNFSLGILDNEIRFTYRFANQSNLLVSGVKIALSSKNNSQCGWGWKPYDGDVPHVFAKPGEKINVFIKPEKYVFNPDRENCRQKPYYDIVLERLSEYKTTKCPKPCRRPNYWICNNDMESLLPVCENEDENRCFDEALEMAQKDMLIKPCTKLHYKVEVSSYTLYPEAAEFELAFNKPPIVTVKEEYRIYDLVAMISAVGGTMGLCTGFSFRELTNILLRYIEKAYKCIKTKIGLRNNKPKGRNIKKRRWF